MIEMNDSLIKGILSKTEFQPNEKLPHGVNNNGGYKDPKKSKVASGGV